MLIIIDVVYGAARGRDSLITWMQSLMGVIALFALFRHDIREISVGADGVTIRQRQIAEAAAALTAAEASRLNSNETAQEAPKERAQRIADIVSRAANDGWVTGKSILWVDDRPSNNIYERQSLESLGIQFTISTSTEDALQKLDRRSYDVIISDMGRPPDSRAGYTLLDALKQQGEYPPFVIYAGSNSPKHKREAKERGGWGTTDRPQELFELVLSALRSQSAH